MDLLLSPFRMSNSIVSKNSVVLYFCSSKILFLTLTSALSDCSLPAILPSVTSSMPNRLLSNQSTPLSCCPVLLTTLQPSSVTREPVLTSPRTRTIFSLSKNNSLAHHLSYPLLHPTGHLFYASTSAYSISFSSSTYHSAQSTCISINYLAFLVLFCSAATAPRQQLPPKHSALHLRSSPPSLQKPHICCSSPLPTFHSSFFTALHNAPFHSFPPPVLSFSSTVPPVTVPTKPPTNPSTFFPLTTYSLSQPCSAWEAVCVSPGYRQSFSVQLVSDRPYTH